MKVTFRGLAMLYCLFCLVLAGIFLLDPALILSEWQIDFSDPVGLVARRCGAFFTGLAVMFFCARNAQPSLARTAIVKGFVVAMLILAGLGVMEFATGHAGPGILTAVAFEISCVIALALVVGVRSSRINVDQTVA